MKWILALAASISFQAFAADDAISKITCLNQPTGAELIIDGARGELFWQLNEQLRESLKEQSGQDVPETGTGQFMGRNGLVFKSEPLNGFEFELSFDGTQHLILSRWANIEGEQKFYFNPGECREN